MSSSGMGRESTPLTLSTQDFLCRARLHPPHGSGEALVAHDMPECQFPRLGSCQKKFLWIHEEVDLAPQFGPVHSVFGPVPQVEDDSFGIMCPDF